MLIEWAFYLYSACFLGAKSKRLNIIICLAGKKNIYIYIYIYIYFTVLPAKVMTSKLMESAKFSET